MRIKIRPYKGTDAGVPQDDPSCAYNIGMNKNIRSYCIPDCVAFVLTNGKKHDPEGYCIRLERDRLEMERLGG